MIRKVLCLGFWSPPSRRPQAILLGKMIPEWLRVGLNPVVLTYAQDGQWNLDVPLATLPIYRRPGWAKLTKTLGAWSESRYEKSILSTASEIVVQTEPELIFSFANPQKSNLLGVALKKRYGLPFVSHFSDPFVDCPIRNLSGRQARLARSQEEEIIYHSDRIVFVNERLRDLVMGKYAPEWKKRATVIPHCYDPTLYPEGHTKQKSTPITLSHIGAFYAQRNPETLFQALSSMKVTDPNLAQKLRIELVGGASDYSGYSTQQLDQLLARYGLEDMVITLPSVDYEESLYKMKKADGLILIDTNIENSPFLPSKLIDYLGSGRPILAIADSGTPSMRVVDEVGGLIVGHNQVEPLVSALEKLIVNGAMAQPDLGKIYAYHVENTTKNLLNVFQEAIDDPISL